MATVDNNKELLKKATEKLGAEKVQSAIKDAGLTKTAIDTLQPKVIDTPVNTEQIKVDTPVVDTPVVEDIKTPTTNINITAPKKEVPQTTEGVAGFEEGQVVIPKVNTIDQTPEQIAKIESDKLAIEEQKKLAEKQESIDYTTGFNSLVEQGASQKELNSYLNTNKDLYNKNKTTLLSNYKTGIINKNNADFVNTYGNLNNEQLNEAVKNGTVIPGSKEYNLLSPEQRASYESYKESQDLLSEKANIVTGEASNFQSILSEIKNIFSSDIKQEYTNALNSPEIKNLESKSTSYANQINSIDDQIEYIREDALEAYPDLAQSSFIMNGVISDRTGKLRRERNQLVNQYNTNLAEIANKKSDIETNLKLSQYEDGINRDAYTTALGLYQTERNRMDSIQMSEFEAKNKEIAENVKFQRDLIIKQFENDLKSNDRSGGTYGVDKDGRTIYMLNGVSEVVTDANGDVVFELEDEEAKFKDTVNFKDGIYYTQRTYTDGTIQQYTSDIQGNRIGPSLNTVDFIKSKEGYRGTAYKDSAGVWTLGYGFTNIDGNPVQEGDTITQIVADAELQKQISQYTNYEKYITVDLSEEQKTALNSFEYNLGKGIWNTTGKGIIDAINSGNLSVASEIMKAHNKARNPETKKLEEIKGLTNRRNEEAELLTVKYNPASKYSQEAQDWAKNISRGTATVANVPDKIRTEVSSALANIDIALEEDNPIIQGLQNQFNIIDEIVDWEGEGTGFFGNDTTNESLVEDISGGFQRSPIDALTGEKGQLLGKIQFLLDEQPLQKLIDIKAQGGTFGALSEKELALLTNSSSLLNSTAKRDDGGNLTGFNLSEKDLKKHLRLLKNGYSKAIEKKSGVKEVGLDDIYTGIEQNTPTNTVDLSSSLDY